MNRQGGWRALLAELGDPFTRIGADTAGRVSIDRGVCGRPEKPSLSMRCRRGSAEQSSTSGSQPESPEGDYLT
jgi:hypothetical protein